MVRRRLSSKLDRDGMGGMLECFVIFYRYWSGIIYTPEPDEGSRIYRLSDYTIQKVFRQLSLTPSIVCTVWDKAKAWENGCLGTWILPRGWQGLSASYLVPIPVRNGIPKRFVMIHLRNHIPKCLTLLLSGFRNVGRCQLLVCTPKILFRLDSG